METTSSKQTVLQHSGEGILDAMSAGAFASALAGPASEPAVLVAMPLIRPSTHAAEGDAATHANSRAGGRPRFWSPEPLAKADKHLP